MNYKVIKADVDSITVADTSKPKQEFGSQLLVPTITWFIGDHQFLVGDEVEVRVRLVKRPVCSECGMAHSGSPMQVPGGYSGCPKCGFCS